MSIFKLIYFLIFAALVAVVITIISIGVDIRVLSLRKKERKRKQMELQTAGVPTLNSQTIGVQPMGPQPMGSQPAINVNMNVANNVPNVDISAINMAMTNTSVPDFLNDDDTIDNISQSVNNIMDGGNNAESNIIS